MQKHTLIFRILTLLLLVGFAAGCKKNDEVKPATQEDFASAQATLDIIAEIESLNDMTMNISQETSTNKAARKAAGRIAATKESVCGNYTYSYTEAGSVIITIDFSSGQICSDSITRSGKLIYTIAPSGNSISVQFDSYKANGKQLDGDYAVSLTYGEESFTYDFAFKNAVLTYADGSKVKWNSSYEMALKFVSPTKEEDILAIELVTSGGIIGTTQDGKAFSATISTPLFVTSNCQYGLTKGVYLIKVAGHPNATYDFGDGTCDNTATLTINGTSKTFSLEN